MSIYSLGQNTTVTTIAASAMDILASSSNSPKVYEIGVSLAAGTSSTYGLGRAGNTPVQTSGVAVLPENPSDPTGQSKVAVAWGTAPTVPGNYARRISLPPAIGAGIIWTFPRGFTIAASAALELWNITANSANTNVSWVVDE